MFRFVAHCVCEVSVAVVGPATYFEIRPDCFLFLQESFAAEFRASPTVLQFLFYKIKSLPSLKSICQVIKLSVSNNFGKIELAKPNGGPGRYFFTRFFSSRRPLRRTGSLARSPTRCVALPPPSVRAGAFASRKKSGRQSTVGRQGIVVHPTWERRAVLNSLPQAAQFSDYGSRRRRVWRCFRRKADGGAC